MGRERERERCQWARLRWEKVEWAGKQRMRESIYLFDQVCLMTIQLLLLLLLVFHLLHSSRARAGRHNEGRAAITHACELSHVKTPKSEQGKPTIQLSSGLDARAGGRIERVVNWLQLTATIAPLIGPLSNSRSASALRKRTLIKQVT